MATITIGSYEYTEDEVDALRQALLNKDHTATSTILKQKDPNISFYDFCIELERLAAHSCNFLAAA